MSGICGILYFDDRRASLEEILPMNKAIAFRGRDESGARAEGPAALGNCLLRTTPESVHEHFPIEDSEAGLILTADARIDNRDELIPALAITQSSDRPVTDGALILRAYQKWGEGCPEHLVGDFAFAIWDARERTLFCARDHFGARPFCYYQDKGRFLFASEVSGIIAIPDVPRRLDELFLANFLLLYMDEIEHTGFKDIFRLPASHCLLLRAGGNRAIRRYWRLDPDREISFSSEEAYYEEFRKRLFKAVECRCRSITPVAAELSGGLDSSMVTAAAQPFLKRSGRSLKTFTHARARTRENFGIEDISKFPSETDERPLVELIVARLGLANHCYITDGDVNSGFTEQVRFMLETYGAPKISLYGCVADILHRRIENGGMRVLLSGLGGDQIASNHGGGYYAELVHGRQWKTLWNEAKGVATNYQISRCHFLFSAIFLDRRPWLHHLLRKLFRGASDPRKHNLTKSAFTRDFACRMNASERYRHQMIYHILGEAVPAITHKGYQILDAEWGYIPNSMEERSAAALLRSIECRYPLLDKRLAEYVLAVPSHIKVRDGWRRRLARKSFEGLLPPEVAWRVSKHGPATIPYVTSVIEKDEKTLTQMADAMRTDPYATLYINAQLVYETARSIGRKEAEPALYFSIVARGVMAGMFLKTVAHSG